MRRKYYHEIKELYLQGISGLEIARQLDICPETVKRTIREMKASNDVPIIKPKRTKETAERQKRVMDIPNYDGSPKVKKYVKPTLAPGETVKCTMAVSKTCVYGISGKAGSENGKCRFLSVTGHSRYFGPNGCSWKACTQYSRISKESPRIKGGD